MHAAQCHTSVRDDGLRSPAMSVSVPQLVGRDAELEVLDDVLASVEGGAPQALGVLGEPGIGKSRLLAELAGAALRVARRLGDRPRPPAGDRRDLDERLRR